MRPYEWVENPIIREQRVVRHDPMWMYKPDPVCCCGCKRELVEGWEWEGDYFFEDDCILRYMKSTYLQPFNALGEE